MHVESAPSRLACTAPFGFAEEPGRLLAAFARLGCVTSQYYRKVDDPTDASSRHDSTNIPAALRVTTAAGVRFDSIHGVFSEHIDPSSPDAEHRRECLVIYQDEAKVATALGGTMVIVHPGAINPGKHWLPMPDAVASQAARHANLADFLPRLAEIGEHEHITFLIENLPFSCTTGFDPVALAEHLRRVNSPRLRMCLDTGHAHCTADTLASPSNRTVAAAITTCADVIAYLHVHDNHADADSHLVPGEGSIDWTSVSNAVEPLRVPRMLELFQPAMTIEALAQSDFHQQINAWMHTHST